MPTITGDAGNNTLTGSADGDLIEGLGGNDTLFGLAGDDGLIGGDGDDILRGGDGDDFVQGGAGADILDGGSGIDIASYGRATAGVQVDLNVQGVAQNTGEGLDLLISIENLEGSAFNDVLTGDDAANIIYETSGGDDVLAGGGGDDEIRINRGAAPTDFAFEWITADGGTGDDMVSFNAFNMDAGRVVMRGGSGNDTLLVEGSSLGTLDIWMDGGTGDDVITAIGASGADIHGGDGNDIITIDVQGRFNVDLGTGADRLFLTGAPPGFSPAARVWVENCTAGVGGDVINLSGLLASAGLTNFPAGSNPFETGHLRLFEVNAEIVQLHFVADGGAGEAVVLLNLRVPRASLSSYNFDGFRPVPAIINGTALGEALQGIEDDDTLNGLGGADTLVGGGGDDALDGGEGNDILFGDYHRADDRANGDDLLNGGIGNDVLIGGGGDDVLNGGDGMDILITGAAGNDSIYPPLFYFNPILDHGQDSGADVLDGGAAFDTAHLLYASETRAVVFDNSNASAINQITVGGANHGSVTAVEVVYVHGGSAGDTLTGGRFDDMLFGNAGDDRLAGGEGRDNLQGGGGDDELTGGLGNDTIDGGAGWDTLVLGGARSAFKVLRSGDDFIVAGPDGLDRLTGVEMLRFSDGSVVDLAKMYASEPQVLPAVPDEEMPASDAPDASGPPGRLLTIDNTGHAPVDWISPVMPERFNPAWE